MSSLSTNFNASANDWKRPNGPTRFGPGRSWMSALPRRSTHTMIGVTLSIAPRTIAIFSTERPTSTQSIPCIVVLRLHRRRFGDRKCGNVIERAKLGGFRIEHRPDAAIHLEVAHGLSFRRIGLMDSLHASLKVGEEAFLLGW